MSNSDVVIPLIKARSKDRAAHVPASVSGCVGGVALGIDTGTAVSRVSRGFQPLQKPENLVEEIDYETGEVIAYRQTKRGKVRQLPRDQARSLRWARKAVVNEIFPNTRHSKCCRCRRSRGNVTIVKSREHGTCHYKNLVLCGSPWACPICAAKIAERRRADLVAATDAAKLLGYRVVLATFTIRHGMGDDINDLLDRLGAAWRWLTMNSNYKAVRDICGIVGTVRALEVTYGQNGFHPHYHVLIFTNSDNPAVAAELELYLRCLWQQACKAKGLPEPSKERGVKVDDGEWAAKYATKWGIEDEMTKAHLKTAKGIKGLTPFQFLDDVIANDSEKSRRLFAVYALAFKGRRQLYWSNGLRDLLGLNKELTDEEAATVETDETYELASISLKQWRAVLFNRAEAALLDLAERDPESIPMFLDMLCEIAEHRAPEYRCRGSDG